MSHFKLLQFFFLHSTNWYYLRTANFNRALKNYLKREKHIQLDIYSILIQLYSLITKILNLKKSVTSSLVTLQFANII